MDKSIPWFAVLVLTAGAGAATAAAEDVVFPPDAGVVDLTRPPYNVKPDGKTDCTEALNKALAPKGQFVYLPNGTYLVSDTITWNRTNRDVLQGQNREKTIITLKDRCPGFDDPDNPKWVVEAGKAGSNDFFNSVYNLTIDTGAGNPGAKGMKFHTSNRGTVRDVLIRSGDPKRIGPVGLDLAANGPGPGLIKNVRVEGFDVGIGILEGLDSAGNPIDLKGFNMTFEHVELVGQTVVGIGNVDLPIAIRGLKSTNRVPALRNATSFSFVTLVDALLEGGSPETPAIENVKDGGLLARNITVGGYQVAVRSTVGGTTTSIPGPKVEEFSSHGVRSVLPGAAGTSLNLPVEETPELPWGDVDSDWASVADYKRPESSWGDAAQRAVDSGRSTVYFPHGTYTIDRTIHVRGNVRRIMGMESRIHAASGVSPLFRVEDGTGDVVMIERFIGAESGTCFVEHASKRTLVIRHVPFRGYVNSVPGGKVFLEDFIGVNLRFDRQRVWMRGWNCEAKGGQDSFNGINRGGDLWVLGVKTEGPKTVITTSHGGRTELLGGTVYPNRGTDGQPAFLCQDALQSLSYPVNSGWISPDALYEEQVREVRGGKTWSLWRGDVPKRGGPETRGGGLFVPLYVGYTGEEAARPAPSDAEQAQGPRAFYRGGLGRTGQYHGPALRESHGIKWKFDESRGRLFAGAPVVAGSAVYVGDKQGSFYALDRETGAKRWELKTGGMPGPAAVARGMVYFGGGNVFYAADTRTGQERWRFQTEGTTCYAPAVVGRTVLFASGDGNLYAADATTGLERWRLRTPYPVASGPAVAGGTAYVGLLRGIQAVDTQTGTPRWTFTTGATVRYPMVADGVVYLPCEKLYAVDARSGKEIWSRKVFENTDPRAALADGLIYLGAPRHAGIHLIDARTGQQRRKIQFPVGRYDWRSAIYGGPALAGGVLYFNQMHAWSLTAVDSKTGKRLWSTGGGLGGPDNGAPVVADGVVYVGTADGLLAIH